MGRLMTIHDKHLLHIFRWDCSTISITVQIKAVFYITKTYILDNRVTMVGQTNRKYIYPLFVYVSKCQTLIEHHMLWVSFRSTVNISECWLFSLHFTIRKTSPQNNSLIWHDVSHDVKNNRKYCLYIMPIT